jgi:multiple sugar transport system ATP-binding protein
MDPEESRAMLELASVTKTFGSTLAVDQLSLLCAEQEFLVIFGPAGAGKTTTLRLIAGITQPSSGDIRFRERSLCGVPPEHRNMSMVFENYALYSHMTVFDNLAFPLRARKHSESEVRQRVLQMAETIHMTGQLDRRPGFLSGGQRQRVALGRGLIRDADIYLLDEPIAHLDARLRHQMRAELKAVCARKRATVIHVTHDYREAMALSNRVAVMEKGRLVQLASPEEVYHRPATEFVAGFVGDPPMSLVEVDYGGDGPEPAFHVRGQGNRIPVGNGVAECMGELLGSPELRLGMRATDVTVSHAQDDKHNIPGEVYVVEAQGHRNLITAKLGRDLVQVAVPSGDLWKVKDSIWLRLDDSNIHVYAGGKGIYHPPSKSPNRPLD